MHSRIEPSGYGRKGVLGRGIVRGIFILLAILLLSGIASAWSNYHNELNNSGHTAIKTNTDGNINWTYNTGQNIRMSPVIDTNGTVYFGTYDNNIFSVFKDGSLNYTVYMGNYNSIQSYSPSIGSLFLYFKTLYGYSGLKQMFLNNGTVKTTFSAISYSYETSPRYINNDLIYISTYEGSSSRNRLYALNSTFSILWSFDTNSDSTGNYGVDEDYNVFIGDAGGVFYAIHSNGTSMWNYTGIGAFTNTPIIDDSNNLVCISNSTSLSCLNKNNGTLRWWYNTTFLTYAPSFDSQKNIYLAGASTTKLVSLDVNGNYRWNFTFNNTLNNEFASPITDGNDIIFIGDSGGVFYAINLNGTLKWLNNTGDNFRSTAAISAVTHDIIITGNSGVLYAFKSQVPSTSFDPAGYVNDSLGNPLAGVNVTLSNATASASNTSDVLGFWNLSGQLSDGLYNYSAQKAGYTTTTGSETFTNGGTALVNITLTVSTVTISCPIGWCYAASNYSSKTLLELDNLFSTDTIQGYYDNLTKKYVSHRTGYKFNENQSVSQGQGYYYYFSSAQDVTMTIPESHSINLVSGWNIISNFGANRTLSALATSITNVTTKQRYNATTKKWVDDDLDTVKQGEGFFAYVSANTTWTS